MENKAFSLETVDLAKQLEMLHKDGYLDAEQIIRALLRKIKLSDLCSDANGTTPLVEKLRAYVEDYRSGATLNRMIRKTDDIMEEAADVIEYLQAKINAQKREFEYMKSFANEACFDEEVCRDQLRSLWTAYCLHNDLLVDTAPYDNDVLELWSVVSLGEEDTAEWSDFDSYDDFMHAYLI